jgi:hypothetical protein
MENGIHLHSMCRQIHGTPGNVSEFVQGTKGSWTSGGHVIRDLKGNEVWKYDYEAQKANFKQNDPYTLEHVNWINHIRSGKPIEQASETAVANMAAIMGRESAYTGQTISWEKMTAAEQNLYPADIDIAKKMAIVSNGYGAGKEFKLPDFIHIPGQPQGAQKR